MRPATLVVFVLLGSSVRLAQDTTAEAPIRAIIAEQAAAWSVGDGVAYARPLAPDASFTNLFGVKAGAWLVEQAK